MTCAARASSRRSSSSGTATRRSFGHEGSEELLRGFLSGELFRRGLICRADDRGDPVIQLSPPLVAGPEQFEEIEAILRPGPDGGGRTGAHERDADRPRAAGGGRAGARRAGTNAASAPRCGGCTASELPDPTPWLAGGELLLTTGIALDDEEQQRAYVERLGEHRIAGVGLGVGFEHDALPPALLEAAREHDLPVFEVPYEVPFIALAERAYAHLVSEQYAALRRSTEIGARLERLVLEERGLDEVIGDGRGGDRRRRGGARRAR